MLGADVPKEETAFDHDTQDPFPVSERTSRQLNFAIKNPESTRARDGME
jgi:hypothetical protein